VKEVEARRTVQGNRGNGSPSEAGAHGQLSAGGVEDEEGSGEPGGCDSVEVGDGVTRGGMVAARGQTLALGSGDRRGSGNVGSDEETEGHSRASRSAKRRALRRS
jgi:hypothetical protein